jgi:hypothetical protein
MEYSSVTELEGEELKTPASGAIEKVIRMAALVQANILLMLLILIAWWFLSGRM